MACAYLSLGSNIGDREYFLRSAVDLIKKEIGSSVKCSGVYQSAPWGFEAETPFLNMAAVVETILSPEDLLDHCASIEKRLNRVRSSSGNYISRTIDVDIIYYDDRVLNLPNLIIPHKFMHERNFVLVPLEEIAPDKMHPVFNKSTVELLTACPDKLPVSLINQELFPRVGV